MNLLTLLAYLRKLSNILSHLTDTDTNSLIFVTPIFVCLIPKQL